MMPPGALVITPLVKVIEPQSLLLIVPWLATEPLTMPQPLRDALVQICKPPAFTVALDKMRWLASGPPSEMLLLVLVVSSWAPSDTWIKPLRTDSDPEAICNRLPDPLIETRLLVLASELPRMMPAEPNTTAEPPLRMVSWLSCAPLPTYSPPATVTREFCPLTSIVLFPLLNAGLSPRITSPPAIASPPSATTA